MKNQFMPQFVMDYKGVEGFYFLNRHADLGYIRAVDVKPVKETFPQLHNREFMRRHPSFLSELEGFLRDTQELCRLFLGNADPSAIELGYLVPTNQHTHGWRSATLVLHNHVINTLRQDYERSNPPGTPALSGLDPRAEELQGERSVQHGLDTLVHHVDAQGNHPFFPVLFYRSRAASHDPRDIGIRVINLCWRRTADEVSALTGKRRSSIFDVLRRNLEAHGAIDRSRRAQGLPKPRSAPPARPTHLS